MTLLALNLLLALAWSALFGGFSRENLALGFAVGFVALWLVQPLFGPTRYFGKLADVTRLLLFFAKELVVSSLRVVSYVFLPASRHGYEQPPYEEISAEQYRQICHKLKPIRGDLPHEHELEARYCEGGVCDYSP